MPDIQEVEGQGYLCEYGIGTPGGGVCSGPAVFRIGDTFRCREHRSPHSCSGTVNGLPCPAIPAGYEERSLRVFCRDHGEMVGRGEVFRYFPPCAFVVGVRLTAGVGRDRETADVCGCAAVGMDGPNNPRCARHWGGTPAPVPVPVLRSLQVDPATFIRDHADLESVRAAEDWLRRQQERRRLEMPRGTRRNPATRITLDPALVKELVRRLGGAAQVTEAEVAALENVMLEYRAEERSFRLTGEFSVPRPEPMPVDEEKTAFPASFTMCPECKFSFERVHGDECPVCKLQEIECRGRLTTDERAALEGAVRDMDRLFQAEKAKAENEKTAKMEAQAELRRTRQALAGEKETAESLRNRLRELSDAHNLLKGQAVDRSAEIAALREQIRQVASGQRVVDFRRPVGPPRGSGQTTREIFEKLLTSFGGSVEHHDGATTYVGGGSVPKERHTFTFLLPPNWTCPRDTWEQAVEAAAREEKIADLEAEITGLKRTVAALGGSNTEPERGRRR